MQRKDVENRWCQDDGERGDGNQHNGRNTDDRVLAFCSIVFEVISLNELGEQRNEAGRKHTTDEQLVNRIRRVVRAVESIGK